MAADGNSGIGQHGWAMLHGLLRESDAKTVRDTLISHLHYSDEFTPSCNCDSCQRIRIALGIMDAYNAKRQ